MIDVQQKRTGIECVQVTLSELLQLSHLAKLSLSEMRIKNFAAGSHQSRLLGRGMEFAESRRYQIGDDVRNIDWRLTARFGKAHTKLFAAEKERQVLLMVDMRSSMFFATRGVFKSVQASLLAGLITWNAVQTANRVGGMIFDDENQYEFRPALGKKGALPFLEQLAKSAAFVPKKSCPPKDIPLESIKRHISPGCLLFIVSDFRHLHAQDMLIQMAKTADIRLCFIYDPLESALPQNGRYPVTDGNSTIDLNTFDKNSVAQYHQQFIQRKEKIDSLANHAHIRSLTCSTEDDCLDVLKNNFRL